MQMLHNTRNCCNFKAGPIRTLKNQHIDGKQTHIVAIPSPFHEKISNNNITSLDFKCRIYYVTARSSF